VKALRLIGFVVLEKDSRGGGRSNAPDLLRAFVGWNEQQTDIIVDCTPTTAAHLCTQVGLFQVEGQGTERLRKSTAVCTAVHPRG
jgi:hypothetical protein